MGNGTIFGRERGVAQSIRHRNHLTTGTGRERDHDGSRGITQEMHRAIREHEIRPARMEAPEMVRITGIFEPAWTELERTTALPSHVSSTENNQKGIRCIGIRPGDSLRSIPNAYQPAPQSRPLADEKRLTCSVRDLADPHSANIPHSPIILGPADDSQVRRIGGRIAELIRDWGCQSPVRWTGIKRNYRGQAGMWRVVVPIPVCLIRLEGLPPQGLLLDIWQEHDLPIQEDRTAGNPDVTQSGRECALRIVVMMEGHANLSEVVATTDPGCRLVVA